VQALGVHSADKVGTAARLATITNEAILGGWVVN
jgi:hypothetical protein